GCRDHELPDDIQGRLRKIKHELHTSVFSCGYCLLFHRVIPGNCRGVPVYKSYLAFYGLHGGALAHDDVRYHRLSAVGEYLRTGAETYGTRTFSIDGWRTLLAWIHRAVAVFHSID